MTTRLQTTKAKQAYDHQLEFPGRASPLKRSAAEREDYLLQHGNEAQPSRQSSPYDEALAHQVSTDRVHGSRLNTAGITSPRATSSTQTANMSCGIQQYVSELTEVARKLLEAHQSKDAPGNLAPQPRQEFATVASLIDFTAPLTAQIWTWRNRHLYLNGHINKEGQKESSSLLLEFIDILQEAALRTELSLMALLREMISILSMPEEGIFCQTIHQMLAEHSKRLKHLMLELAGASEFVSFYRQSVHGFQSHRTSPIDRRSHITGSPGPTQTSEV